MHPDLRSWKKVTRTTYESFLCSIIFADAALVHLVPLNLSAFYEEVGIYFTSSGARSLFREIRYCLIGKRDKPVYTVG